jgi:hypothetical protein
VGDGYKVRHCGREVLTALVITDLILAVVALLRRDMDKLARVVWEVLELVKL